MADVSAAVGVPVKNLSSGRKRWDKWLDVACDEEDAGAAHLQDMNDKPHGLHWPVEWTNHTQATWEDERCTRKGEGMADYVHDPQFRKGRGEPHVVHYIEMKMHETLEIMQTTEEASLGPDYVCTCVLMTKPAKAALSVRRRAVRTMPVGLAKR